MCRPGLRRDVPVLLGHGVAGFPFAASGPLAIVLATGTRGGLAEAELPSWAFGPLAINGALSIAYSVGARGLAWLKRDANPQPLGATLFRNDTTCCTSWYSSSWTALPSRTRQKWPSVVSMVSADALWR